jgi:hypothetical protein
MVNELSQYDMGITFKQKWVKKYWTLATMKHMEKKNSKLCYKSKQVTKLKTNTMNKV